MKRIIWWGLVTGCVALAFYFAPRKTAPSNASHIAAITPVPGPAPTPATQPSRSPVVAPFKAPPAAAKPAAQVSPAQPARADLPQAFAAFDEWARQFSSSGAGSAGTARGVALAWKRREAMLELIRTNPALALQLTVPYQWRTALPDNITRLFEQQVDGRGAFKVAIADSELGPSTVLREVQVDGQRYHAFVYGRRLGQKSQFGIPLHGIALEKNLAVAAEPLRLLGADEAQALAKARGQSVPTTCGVCGQTVSSAQGIVAETGGELACFCGTDHAKTVSQHWITLESGKSSSGPLASVDPALDAWTHGDKTLLYMRVNFPDDLTEPISEAQAYLDMDEVNTFYVEGSYNATTMTTMVTPLLTLPQPKVYYSTNDFGTGALLDDSREAARLAGYDTDNYDLDIVAFTSVPTYTFGGLGGVGWKAVWLQSLGAGVTAHELGHNYGIMHANFWNTVTNDATVSYGPGANIGYGNPYDTMGAASAGNNQFNTIFKNQLDWLPDTAITSIVSNGVYRIYPFDEPTRVNGRSYAARVRRDYQRDLWMEFRQRFAYNPWIENGLMLNWSPWAESDGGTDLLDMTPGSAFDRADAALVIGQTFNDDPACLYVTPLARGATGTNMYIDVQVNLGPFPGNQQPELNVEVESNTVPVDALVHFHATAKDPDGDALAYAWSFDDATFSTNNQPWTFKSWTAAGEHVVRCVVSDMKGGIASANVLVTVGAPAGFQIAGRILDTNGVPIEGVRVSNNVTNSPYYSGYTGSDGRFIITGVAGELELNAFKYGYTFSNTWANPLPGDTNFLNADVVAMPMPAVTVRASTNAIPENGGGTNCFILSRTGDPTNSLTAMLYLSGSATFGVDYNLTADLVAGTNNFIEFPSGTNELLIYVRPVNDSQVEGPETVTLTVLDDPNRVYVVGSPGEATVTILDDDAASKPSLIVTATTSVVAENGADSGEFVITRTGSGQNDLMVYYSMSGTATPGADYATPLGVVLMPAGQTKVSVRFQPIDDKDVEPDETVKITLTANSAYSIASGTAQMTIVDDDITTVTVFPTGDWASEPSAGGRITVKRDGDLTGALTVNYNVGGTASNGVDYVALSGSVTIPAGETSTDIYCYAIDDPLPEGDESVIVTLVTNAAYSVGTPGTATLWIRDDEKPSVSIIATDNTANEPGDDFGAFTIMRDGATSGSLTVYLAINGTAINGVDYVPLDSTVVIPAGASSVTLDLIAFDDLAREPAETVILSLLPSTNYNLGYGTDAVVQIEDNDGESIPAAGFGNAASSALESLSPGVMVFLSSTSAEPVTVNYRVLGGTALPSDYTLADGPITFAPGQRAQPIPLQIRDNTTADGNRTIRLVLYDPIGATLDGIKIHTYTIIDDDAGSVSVTATAASGSESGLAAGNFRISRSGRTNAAQVVNFQITGTASAPTDYAPLGTSTTIPAGATYIDLPVVPVDDPTVEHGETVVMTLISAPGGLITSPNVAAVTISDNDSNSLPVVGVSSANGPAAVEGGVNGEFVFSRGATNGTLTVNLTCSGMAIGGVDYVPLTNSVTFTNGQATVSLPVTAIDDSYVQGERPLMLSIIVSDRYRAEPAVAKVTIQDNDQTVRVDASDFTAAEPGKDTGEFTFTRFGTTNTDVRVYFSVSGTASNGVDYVALTNSWLIPAGSLAATMPLVPLDDFIVEQPETVTLTLLPDNGYFLGANTNATVTIEDNEPGISIIASVPEVTEGSQKPGVFTIVRKGDPTYDFKVYYAVSGTAIYGVDYPPFMTNIQMSCSVTAIDLLVFPTNELVIEPSESVIVTLLPDPAYTIMYPSNATVTILDAGTNSDTTLNLAPVVAITSPTAEVVFLLSSNANMILEATVSDDSTNPPPVTSWSKVSGPDTMAFGNTNMTNTTVSFTGAGVYVLRVTADDGTLQQYDDVTVVVDAVDLLATNCLRWALDETNGTSIADSSGAGRAGVLVGGGDWTTNGVVGGALRLAGTNDYIYGAGASNWLNGLKAFSLSLWVNSAATNFDQGIFAADDGTSTNVTLSLFTRATASCGQNTNVIEALIPTSEDTAHLISTNNATTNGWLHLVVAWSNGLAPALYVNGQVDQPLASRPTLKGFLTNCPQFIVGRSPLGSANSWNGWIDDVRLFERALSPTEIAALASLPPTNYGAVVDAGPDVTVQWPALAVMAGQVTDDGLPNPPGTVITTWVDTNDPPKVTFSDIYSLTSSVSSMEKGEYNLRLIAADGQVKTYDEVLVTVIEPTRVDVSASDSDAKELGPDTGEFSFTRTGDTNFDLVVNFTFSGIASNGIDFIEVTNVIVFSGGASTTNLLITPYLDHRTEGDQTLTVTIYSNAAYTVGSDQATITIQDSPYGQWTVARFTLEELTDPTLSGEGADIDHDGLVNLAEYAANLDPRTAETNAPMAVALVVDPNDSLPHIEITYHRRVLPTDVGYAAAVSSDLVTWHTDETYIKEIKATPDDNGITETVQAQVVAPYTGAGSQFVTVRVWLQTTTPTTPPAP